MDMVDPGNRERSGGHWLLILGLGLAFWLVVGVVDSVWFYLLGSVKGTPPIWRKLVEPNLPYFLLAGLLTPPVVWVARRAGFGAEHRLRTAAIHFGCAILFTVAHVTFYRGVRSLQTEKPPLLSADFANSVQKHIAGVLDKELVMYLVIVGAVFVHDYYRRFREKEKTAAALELEQVRLRASLSQAQLEALKMQLQPHFLFNALHAISTLIMRGDSKAANQMLLRLSRFLRMTLDSTDAPVVPLAVELEFLDAYLKIQQERFDDRLRVDMDIGQNTLRAAVPNLVLQPLVENSIRHGIGADPGSGIIAIRTWAENDALHIQVRDNGVGLRDGDRTADGVGLGNVRARLEQLYPDAHSFTLAAIPSGGTAATIVIPYRLLQEEEAIRGHESGRGEPVS
jgi:two-component sensor histidine kinase